MTQPCGYRPTFRIKLSGPAVESLDWKVKKETDDLELALQHYRKWYWSAGAVNDVRLSVRACLPCLGYTEIVLMEHFHD